MKKDTKILSPKRAGVTLCAIIVIGCNNKGTPISIREAAEAVGLVSFKDLSRKNHLLKEEIFKPSNGPQGYFQLVRRINKRIYSLRQELGIKTKIIKPDYYIDSFCKEIGFDEKMAEEAKKRIVNKEIEGMKPSGVAAAAIKAVMPENITIQELQKITGVSDTTIRVALKKIQ